MKDQWQVSPCGGAIMASGKSRSTPGEDRFPDLDIVAASADRQALADAIISARTK